jgi:flagellar protein FlgJ
MHSSPASASVYTDFQGLAELRAKARADSPDALRETAEQFEAVFMQMMLKSMREATLKGGLFDSQRTEFYEGMFDQQLALSLAQGQGFGLADVLVRQLSASATPVPAGPPPALSVPRSAEVSASPATPEPSAQAEMPSSPAEFASLVWPHAERAAARIGVAPEVLVAQSALETGWGRGMMRQDDGSPAFNLFGIKTHGAWDGARVATTTHEYVDGRRIEIRDEFRAYASPAESFDDYVDFLQSNPRYRGALAEAGDPGRFLQGLQQAGYATDPDYADKIRSILERPSFGELVGDLKAGRRLPIG